MPCKILTAVISLFTLGFGTLVAPTPAVAALPSPRVERVLGGPGHATVYPSGVEVGPDGTVVAADTGNDGVASFGADGQLRWRVTDGGADIGSLGNVRDVAVDDAGTVYAADEVNGRVVRIDDEGHVLAPAWHGPPDDPIRSPIGVTEKNGEVYVADAGANQIRVFDRGGDQLRTYRSTGECALSRPRDADADEAGNVYAANYTANDVVVFARDGSCRRVWGSKGAEPGQFKNPYGVRVATDPQWGETVYVADSNNNRVQAFTPTGEHRATVGRQGDSGEAGTFTTLRRVAVASDGDVWGADLWGFGLERFDRTSTGYGHTQAIGGTAPPLEPGRVFNEPRQVAVRGDGDLAVVDSVNQRVVQMDPTGEVRGACGTRTSAPTSPNWPRGAAVDAQTGLLWLADTKQSRLQVWRQDCSTVARVGSLGSGPGQTNWPHAIAVGSAARRVFVADTNNDRVGIWDADSRQPLGSFGGFARPKGISVDERTGHVVVADTAHNRVQVLDVGSADDVQVVRTVTGLHRPQGAALDAAGRLWVADTRVNQVRVFGADGTEVAVLRTAEGTALSEPSSVTVAADGTAYVSDTGNDRVLALMAPATTRQTQTTVNGTATSATTGTARQATALPSYTRTMLGPGLADMYPVAVAAGERRDFVVDPGRYRVVAYDQSSGEIVATTKDPGTSLSGAVGAARAIAVSDAHRVYVADTPNHRIQMYDRDLRHLGSFGSKGTGDGQLGSVYGVAVDDENDAVYTVDGDRVQRWTRSGEWRQTFGSGVLHEPRQVTVDPRTHEIHVVSARDRQVVVFDAAGQVVRTYGGQGTGPGQFSGDPRGIAFTPDGETVFVTDDGGRRVLAFDRDGRYKYQVGGPDTFVDPRGISVRDDDTLVVADEWDYAVKEFTVSPTVHQRTLFGTPPPTAGVNSPRGVAAGAAGWLYVDDWWNQRVVRTDVDGGNPLAWGQRGTRNDNGSFNFAWDVAVQPGTGRVFVANRESHQITVFDADGTWLTSWGQRGTENGRLQFPQSLAFAPDGTLWVADSGNHRLQQFTVSDSGTGTWKASHGSFGKDAGELNWPTGLGVAADGTVWVADTRNNRVQRRSPDGAWSALTDAAGRHLAQPWGATVAPDGTVWVTDSGNDRVVRLTGDGSVVDAFSGTDVGAGVFNGPSDVAFGPDGRIWVSDTWNNRVVELR